MNFRNLEPKSRPHFGQITKLLSSNGGYLLGWSDDDKRIAGDAMKLGAPLDSTNGLYNDLRCTYQ